MGEKLGLVSDDIRFGEIGATCAGSDSNPIAALEIIFRN